MGRENEKPNFSIAEDGELLGLLEQAGPPLAEGHLPVHRVLYPPHLNLSTGHHYYYYYYTLRTRSISLIQIYQLLLLLPLLCIIHLNLTAAIYVLLRTHSIMYY